MFKKVLLILILLFILIAPSKDHTFVNSGSILQSFHSINIAYAAEKASCSTNNQKQAVISSWSPYILPATMGIILLGGIGGYWLIFRKKQL